jgi:hypothetical protein
MFATLTISLKTLIMDKRRRQKKDKKKDTVVAAHGILFGHRAVLGSNLSLLLRPFSVCGSPD